MEHQFVGDLAICIVAAWIFGVAAHSLRQTLILAYLVAGFVIGPVGTGLIQDKHSIEAISGIGMILLLFLIGLEIDLKKIRSAGRLILLTSIVQIFGCCALGILVFWTLGFALNAGNMCACYLGFAPALRSTVIIITLLYEKRELDSLPGRIALGVLVLQDLVAI